MSSSSTDQGGSKSLAEEAKTAAKRHADEIKDQAGEAAEETKDAARSIAERQKHASADQLSGVASALKGASDDLEGRGQEFAARYVGQAADGLDELSSSLQNQSVEDLLAGVESFARRQPVAFLGGAVLAGFGLARLMKSSANSSGSASSVQQSMGSSPRPHDSTGGNYSAERDVSPGTVYTVGSAPRKGV